MTNPTTTAPAARSVADLRALPAGVQPQADGRLLCRYCGTWFRSLSLHLRAKHLVSAAVYRAEFALPATLALITDDLREQLSQRRQCQSTDSHLADTPPHTGTPRPPAVSPPVDEARAHALDKRRTHDARAHSLGYRDLTDLLDKTAHLTDGTLGTLMGWSAGHARAWRVVHRQAREHHHASRAAETSRSRPDAHLATPASPLSCGPATAARSPPAPGALVTALTSASGSAAPAQPSHQQPSPADPVRLLTNRTTPTPQELISDSGEDRCSGITSDTSHHDDNSRCAWPPCC